MDLFAHVSTLVHQPSVGVKPPRRRRLGELHQSSTDVSALLRGPATGRLD